jgi:hypothetical protein
VNRVAVPRGFSGVKRKRTTERPDDSGEALRWLWQEPDWAALLQAVVDTYVNAYARPSD